jgi:hypothetical protein
MISQAAHFELPESETRVYTPSGAADDLGTAGRCGSQRWRSKYDQLLADLKLKR